MTDERKLTPKQQTFVLAYLETGVASEAYRRAYDCSRMKDATIGKNAHALTKLPAIATQLQVMRDRATETAILDRAGVINLMTEIATADATQLSQVQVRCCRHCWGVGFRYQWKSDIEYGFAIAEVLDDNAKRLAAWEKIGKGPRPEPNDPPTDEGGYGFDVKREPNPECPKCLGEGIEVVKLRDTRKLTGAAKRLYAGVKKTKDGIEIKTRDQDKALEMLGRVHGVFKDAPGVAVAVGVQTAIVNNVVIPDDPLAAARAYQELMKGD